MRSEEEIRAQIKELDNYADSRMSFGKDVHHYAFGEMVALFWVIGLTDYTPVKSVISFYEYPKGKE